MMRLQNLTEHQLSAIVLPESDDRFDQELVRWFALHGGVWSGTAAELLAAVRTRVDVCNDLWPQSPRALYAHIESHVQILRSLGVDIWLRPGYPRLVSLRWCQDDKPARTPPSGTSGINRIPCDPPTSLPPHADDPETSPADCCGVRPGASENSNRDIPIAESDLAERVVNGKYADEDNVEGRVFESPGEALFAIVEMRGRIREQGLDPKSAIDWVVGRTQEITRCSGVAVGLLEQDSVVYPVRVGIAVTCAGLHFFANLFQSCLRTGETLQLPDAQKDPLVGATCRREGIRSLIIVPLLCNREVAGAVEFLFTERRSFSTVDVMDLELLAGVVSECLSGAAQIEVEQTEEREWPAKPNAVQNLAPQLGHSLNEKAGLVDAPLSAFQDTINAETSLRKPATPESSKPNTTSTLATVSNLLWLALKRAWTSSISAM